MQTLFLEQTNRKHRRKNEIKWNQKIIAWLLNCGNLIIATINWLHWYICKLFNIVCNDHMFSIKIVAKFHVCVRLLKLSSFRWAFHLWCRWISAWTYICIENKQNPQPAGKCAIEKTTMEKRLGKQKAILSRRRISKLTLMYEIPQCSLALSRVPTSITQCMSDKMSKEWKCVAQANRIDGIMFRQEMKLLFGAFRSKQVVQ